MTIIHVLHVPWKDKVVGKDPGEVVVHQVSGQRDYVSGVDVHRERLSYPHPCRTSSRPLQGHQYQEGFPPACSQITFSLFVHNEASADTKVFISSQKVATLRKHRESHSVWMGLEHLVPAPEHIPVHIIMDDMFPTERKTLVVLNGLISRGNCSGIDCFRIRAWVQ